MPVIQIDEPHPTIPNAYTHYYVDIEVNVIVSDWHWNQVNSKGSLITPASKPFPTEQAAKLDAEKHFGGIII